MLALAVLVGCGAGHDGPSYTKQVGGSTTGSPSATKTQEQSTVSGTVSAVSKLSDVTGAPVTDVTFLVQRGTTTIVFCGERSDLKVNHSYTITYKMNGTCADPTEIKELYQ
jgi:hypothetical protein